MMVLNLLVIPLGTDSCITSTDEIDGFAMKMYPNPVQQEIYTETSTPIESVRLFTIDGRLVPIRDISQIGKTLTLHLHDFTYDGFYLLAVTIEGRAYFEKVVVSR